MEPSASTRTQQRTRALQSTFKFLLETNAPKPALSRYSGLWECEVCSIRLLICVLTLRRESKQELTPTKLKPAKRNRAQDDEAASLRRADVILSVEATWRLIQRRIKNEDFMNKLEARKAQFQQQRVYLMIFSLSGRSVCVTNILFVFSSL